MNLAGSRRLRRCQKGRGGPVAFAVAIWAKLRDWYQSAVSNASRIRPRGTGGTEAGTDHENMEPYFVQRDARAGIDRKSTRLNSSHGYTSYAVFCLKK